MAAGRFRSDLYYRLCSDMITTPSLFELTRQSEDVLWELVGYIAQRVAGAEGEAIAGEVRWWIENELGPEYAWPGNIRELEQCVRNIMIRRAYHPVDTGRPPEETSLQASVSKRPLTLAAFDLRQGVGQ